MGEYVDCVSYMLCVLALRFNLLSNPSFRILTPYVTYMPSTSRGREENRLREKREVGGDPAHSTEVVPFRRGTLRKHEWNENPAEKL